MLLIHQKQTSKIKSERIGKVVDSEHTMVEYKTTKKHTQIHTISESKKL